MANQTYVYMIVEEDDQLDYHYDRVFATEHSALAAVNDLDEGDGAIRWVKKVVLEGEG